MFVLCLFLLYLHHSQSQHVALIGDHKQLPPVITSPQAQAQGLGVSLFERLSGEGGLPTLMLDVQYRMHPAISRFPAAEFYGAALRDGTVDAAGNVAPGFVPPQSVLFHELPRTDEWTAERRPPVIFLDHLGRESVKDRSRVNWPEARIVCSLIEDLLLRNPVSRTLDFVESLPLMITNRHSPETILG